MNKDEEEKSLENSVENQEKKRQDLKKRLKQ